MEWRETDIRMPKEGTEVIGFNEKWIDEDFNPKGQRVCFQNHGVGWTCAKWVDSGDTYVTLNEIDGDDAVPTHWHETLEIP